jgi:hypothetical protein
MSIRQPSEVVFLIADSVRREERGLQSLVGVYGGDNIILESVPVPTADSPTLLPQLSVWILLRGVEGDYDVSVQITAPSEEIMARLPSNRFTVPPGGTHTMTLNLIPFPIKELGYYSVDLTIGESRYQYRFQVMARNSP